MKEIIMWLFEKHGIWVTVNICIIGSDEWEYEYKITYLPSKFKNEKRRSIHLVTINSFKEGIGSYVGSWQTPTEAYTEAVNYCLTNLIKNETI